jgi:hypothetical protein
MIQGNLSAGGQGHGKTVQINVAVVFFEEDGTRFAYIPSLDLIGYGKTDDEAEKSLSIVLDEFLRYTLNKDTFYLELQRLGWKVRSKKKPIVPPQMSDLINTNEQLRDIINHKQHSTSNYQINVPAYA